MQAPHFTPEQVTAALFKARGLVYMTAKMLGCHAQTVKNYIARFPEVKAARQEARGRLKDVAEENLFEALEKKERWATEFTLRTIAKSRGYSERTEVTGPKGKPIDMSGVSTERLIAVRQQYLAALRGANASGTDVDGVGTDESGRNGTH